MEKAIVVVSFGTSVKRAYETGIKPIEEAIKKEFVDCHVVNAYTSNIIRKKLRARDNIEIPTVLQVLKTLNDEGYKEIVVQPTHIIPGHEFDKVKGQVNAFKHEYKTVKVSLGTPLLNTPKDFKAVNNSFDEDISQLSDEKALVFVGHGSDHFANSAYFRLLYNFQRQHKNIFMSSVEDELTFEEIANQLKASGIKKAILRPFMIVAGDHAINDMASDEEDSLKTLVEAKGIETDCKMVGLGQNENIVNIFIDKVSDLL